ncbi:hypothetical protein V8C26DRAFT_409988 [Trichoderma gracile]
MVSWGDAAKPRGYCRRRGQLRLAPAHPRPDLRSSAPVILCLASVSCFWWPSRAVCTVSKGRKEVSDGVLAIPGYRASIVSPFAAGLCSSC